MDFNRTGPTCYSISFSNASNGAFIHILRLTYIRCLILELSRGYLIECKDSQICTDLSFVVFPFSFTHTIKPVLSGHSKRRSKICFQDQLSLNAGQKHCRMLQESILQYFRPSLSYNLSLRPYFGYFLVAA